MAIQLTRKLSIGTFGISLLLHVTLFFMVSSWVLIQAVAPKVVPVATDDPYANQAAVEQPPDIMEEDPTPSVPNTDPTEPTETTVVQTGMPTDVITVAGPSSFSLPPSVGIYVPGAAVNTGGAPAGESKGSTDVTKKITVGQIFGTKVEAAKLGVVVDVSGSAHAYLTKAISDIERSFKDAIVVLVMGCGMNPNANSAGKATLFSKADLPKSKDAYAKGKTIKYDIKSQIRGAMDKDSKCEKTFERMKDNPNVYFLEDNGRGNTGAAHFAFEMLKKQGVDTIYWFADFEDAIQDGPMKDVMKDMKSRGIKVIVDNFSGNEKSPGMKLSSQLAKETGGSVTVKRR